MCVTIHEVGEKPVITGWTELSSDITRKKKNWLKKILSQNQLNCYNLISRHNKHQN